MRSRKTPPDRHRRLFQLEALESRVLLSATDALEVAAPLFVDQIIELEHPQSPPPGAITASEDEPVSWIADGDGFWDVAANWSSGAVPGADDDVVIDRGAANPTITIRTAVSVKSLTTAENLVLSSSSLTVASASAINADFTINANLTANGPLTLGGMTTWTGGTLGGTAAITNTGAFTKGSGNLSLLTDLENTGTVNLDAGQLFIDAGKALTNQASGTLNLSGTISTGGTGTLANAGTLNVTGGAPATGLLANTGTVNVDAGVLVLFNGGSSSGLFDVDAGATVRWQNGTGSGTFFLNPGAQLAGDGLYELVGFGSVTLNGETVDVAPRRLHFDPFVQMVGTGKLTIADGADFEFHGGSFAATGGLEVENGGHVGMLDISFGQSISGTTLTNHGTVEIDGTSFSVFQGGTLVNAADGTLALIGQSSIQGPLGATVNNLGTLTYDAEGATATLSLATFHTGTIHGLAGNFSIIGTLVSSGAFDLDAGATLTFAGTAQNYEMTPGTTWSGAGQYVIGGNSSVTIPVGVNLGVAALRVNGTLITNGSYTVPAGGVLSAPSGSAFFAGSGPLTVAAGGELAGESITLVDGATLTNHGTVNLRRVGTSGLTTSTITSTAGATFNIEHSVAVAASVGARLIFDNAGTFNITAATEAAGGSSIDAVFNNTGTLAVLGGFVRLSTLNLAGTSVSSGTFSVAAGARLEFNTRHNFTGAVQWTGAGAFAFAPGNYTLGSGVTYAVADTTLTGTTFTGPGSVSVPAGATWTAAGFPTFNGLGSFSIGIGATFDTNGGVTFTATPVTNSGLLSIVGVGGAALILNNGSAFTNAAGAELRFLPTGVGGGSISGIGTDNSLVNFGLLSRNGGTGELSNSNVALSNPGTIEVSGGSTRFFGDLPQVSEDRTKLLAGTWRVFDGAALILSAIRTQDSYGHPLSTVVENAASVTLAGAGSTFNAVDNLATNSGTLALLDGATLDTHAFVPNPEEDAGGLPPGPLTNTGTLDLGAGSVLHVGTTFTQGAAGTLRIHIADTAANGGAGRLTVDGAATLAGTLEVQLDGGFAPDATEEYAFATFASRSGNFTSFNGVGPLFIVQPAATEYRLISTGALADLAAQSLGVTTSGVVGSGAQLSFTVENLADAATAATSWTDSFYLSPTPTFDIATAMLLGRYERTGALAGHASYSDTLDVTLPAAAPGTWYVLHVVDSRDRVAESVNTNNVRASAPFTVSVPTLVPGTPATGTLAAGQTLLFKTTLPADVVRLRLQTGAAGAAELIVRAGAPPKLNGTDAFAFDPASAEQALLFTSGGEAYVLLRGTALAGAGTSFSLEASVLPFALDESSPTAATNNGEVTLTLRGAQFGAGTAVRLEPAGGGAALTPVRFTVQDATTIFATFDLAGVAPGSYDLIAEDAPESATLPAAFTVLPAPAIESGVEISLVMTVPARVRVGRPGTLLITVFNASGHDIPAPLLNLTSDNASFRLPGSEKYAPAFVELFVLNPEGDPTVLPAGFRASYLVSFLPIEQGDGITSHFETFLADPDAPIDPGKIENDTRILLDYTDAEWALMQPQLEQQLGPTVGDYESRLRALVPLLPASAGDRAVPFDLLPIEVLRAEAALTTSIRGRVDAPGVALGGGTLFAQNVDTGEIFGATLLNDGSFTFTRLTPGSYVFSGNEVLVATHAAESLAADQHLTGVTLTATAGESLRGRLTALPGGLAVSGASLVLSDAAGRLLVADSAADGAYTFTGLAPGSYTLTVEAEGLARLSTEVTIAAGSTALDLALVEEGRISGVAPASAATRIFATRQGVTDGSGFFAVTAEEDGSFILAGLPAGIYDLTVRAEGYLDQEVAGVTVSAGATANVGTIAGVLAGSISGTVTTSDPDLPLPLTVAAFDGTAVVGLAETDETGAFTITGLGPGNYIVTVVAFESFVTSAAVALAEGEDATGAAVTILPGGAIAGVASDSTGSQPLAGVTVFAQAADGTTYRDLTEADGAYRLEHLPVGDYRVFLSLGGAETAQTVNVPSLSGPDVALDLQAAVSARIGGVVQFADGTPLRDAIVQLLRDGRPIATSVSDTAGAYGFLLQEAGTYELRATAGDATFAAVTGLVVTAGQTVAQDVVAGTGTLALTVTDSVSVEGATVELLDPVSGETLVSRVLDATGAVTFGQLAAGTYRVAITAENDRGARTDFVITTGGVNTATVPLAAQFRLSGTVAPAGPAFSAITTVSLYSTADSSLAASVRVAADGSYSIGNLPAGEYRLIALDAGHRPLEQVIDLTGDTTLDLTFAQVADTHFTGRLVDATGTPIRGATVTARDAANRILAFAQTGADGRFDLAGLTQSGLEIVYTVQDLGPFVIAENFDAGTLPGLPDGTFDAGDVAVTFTVAALGGFDFDAALSALSFRGLAARGGEVAALSLPSILPGSTLFNNVRQKAEDFKEDPKHVFDEFTQSPECIDCDKERFAALSAKGLQDTAFRKVNDLREILLTTIDREGATILRETFQNATFVLQTMGTFIGLGLPAGAVAGYEVLLALGNVIQAGAGVISQANSARDPGKEPEDVAASVESTAQLTLNLGQILGSLEKAALQLAGKAYHLDLILNAESIAGIAAQARGTIASLNYDDSRKGALEVAQYYKKFEEAKRDYKEEVKKANEKKDAFYNCLKRASASPDCDHNGGDQGGPNNGGGDGGGNGNGNNGDSGDTGQGKSLDPNDIIGPAGFGPERFVGVQSALPYTIRFENVATASANAAEVHITQDFDDDLDLTTFRPLSYGFGDLEYAVPEGANPFDFQTQLDLRDTLGIFLDVSVEVNLATGVLMWSFTSIDPLTGDIPGDAALGFLPPNVTGPEGEGFVIYSIAPKATAPTGAVIDAQAEIVFDTNEPIVTPAIFNTLDAAAPSSQIAALPAQVGPDFTLNWAGATDDAGGSGIARYNVYVSDDGGAFTPLLLGTTHTAHVFAGTVGHTYRFAVAAIDRAGNAEALPDTADVTVTVVPATELPLTAQTPVIFNDANGDKVTVKLKGPGAGVVTLVNGVAADVNADLRAIALTGTTAASALTVTVAKAGTGNGTTTVGRIAVGDLGSLTLGPGVVLGDGLDDTATDLAITGATKKLALGDLGAFAQVELGAGLDAAGRTALKPTFTAGHVLGPGAAIRVHGGLAATTFKSWNAAGLLTTEQSVAGLTVTQGSFAASVDLDSAGAFAGTAQIGAIQIKAGSLLGATFFVEGAVKSLTVKGDDRTFLSASGIGAVKAGSFTGATLLAGAGGIGNVTATTGPMTNTFITAVFSPVGNLTVKLAKQSGEVAALGGVSVSGSKIGSVTATVTGLAALTAGFGIRDSEFIATSGDIGNIVATASAPGADAVLAGISQSNFIADGRIGNVTATAQSTAKTAGTGRAAGLHGSDFDVVFEAGAAIGAIKATAKGASGANEAFATDLASHVRIEAGTSIGAVTLTASQGKAAGSTARALTDAEFTAGTNVGKLVITGSATAPQAENLRIFAGGGIAGIAIASTGDKTQGSLIGGTILAGQFAALTKNADLAKAAGIGPIALTGSLTDSTLAARGNLGAITIGGNATGSLLVAGLDAGADRTAGTFDDSANAAAQIASVNVLGAWTASSLIAGIAPGTDLGWSQAGDFAGTTLPGITQTSRIGAIKLGAATLTAGTTPFASPATGDHTSAIESLVLTSVQIGKLPALKIFVPARWIDASGDGLETAAETVIRVLS